MLRFVRWGSKAWFALLVAVMVLVTVDVLAGGPLRRLDWVLHEFFDANVRDGLLAAMRAIAKFGQRGILVGLIVPLAVAAAVRLRSPRPLIASVLIMVGLSLLQTGLKSIIPRSFPFGDNDVLFEYGDAYPSGHTLNAFVLIWLILELLVVVFPFLRTVLSPLRRRNIALVTGMIEAVVLTVADMHWFTDVLFSLALGPLLLAGLIALRPVTGGRGGGDPSPCSRRTPC